LQVYAQLNSLGEKAFEAFKFLDAGDHIGVEGPLFVTRTGEQTIKIERWTMLSKALLPLPEKWHGLKDVEARYRQRYLDLIANQEVRELFNRRSRAISEVRSYLVERGFQEVETPMIQPQAGGAAARPFVTKYTALNMDMYLRIAPELYLKRLLVGGFDKVFELNRNFRNEGLSRTHNPEFTMLELYEAYGNVESMKEIVQGLITHVATTIFGGLKVGKPDSIIDLTLPWREVNYKDLILEKMGKDWYDLKLSEARARAEGMGLPIDPAWGMTMISHEVYEKLIEKTLVQPTFVRRFPAELVPLAKACEDDPSVLDVFELVIGGKEVAPAYSEMNDPIEQRKRFEAQVGKDAERLDEDFLLALEHGMPPAGGMGIGIDRLIMTLSGEEAIRDVILFPQLRHKDQPGQDQEGSEEKKIIK
jgi:lysyl-tRNA synthetase class 2